MSDRERFVEIFRSTVKREGADKLQNQGFAAFLIAVFYHVAEAIDAVEQCQDQHNSNQHKRSSLHKFCH